LKKVRGIIDARNVARLASARLYTRYVCAAGGEAWCRRRLVALVRLYKMARHTNQRQAESVRGEERKRRRVMNQMAIYVGSQPGV